MDWPITLRIYDSEGGYIWWRDVQAAPLSHWTKNARYLESYLYVEVSFKTFLRIRECLRTLRLFNEAVWRDRMRRCPYPVFYHEQPDKPIKYFARVT